MEKVLITGITGFIGGELAHRLVPNYDVHGVVKQCRSRDMKSLQDIQEKLILHEADITDFMSLENLINKIKPNKILHLAAISPVRASFEHPLEYNEVNAKGTINIISALHKLEDFKDRRLVIASTAETYGLQPKKEPFKEDLLLIPSSPYACTKAYCDMYLKMMNEVHDFNGVTLRCANTYGRKYDKSFYVEYLVDKMLKNEEVYIGAPDSVRDYMYIDNHVNAYVLAMEKPEAKGEVFNAATGIGTKNSDLALKIADIIGYDKKKLHLGEYPPNYPNRPISSDQPYLILDSGKIKNMLGWPDPLSLDEGLRKTVDYWKKNLN